MVMACPVAPSGWTPVIRIALAVVALALYCVPSFIAVNRNKRNKNAIVALNLLLGWTFVGWVVALVWSLMQEEPDPGQT